MPLTKRLNLIFAPLIHPLIAITLSLFAGSLAILVVGENPLSVYRIMWNGAFGSTFTLFATLTRATPIIICGLGAAVAWKSGYRGIGGEGQMIWGGFLAAIIALNAPGPPFVRIFLALIVGVAAGGAYSLISAWLLDKFKVSLAISTLMMNFVASLVVLHFVSGVFLDRTGADIRIMQTEQLATYMRIPRFVPHHTLHYGFILAVVLVFVVWFVMSRTNFGYEARMTGLNLNFSDYGGVGGKKVMYSILIISGFISAFAGVVEVFGVNYRYVDGAFTSASFAWIGLAAALISRFHPIGVLLSSIILSGISTGGSAVGRATAMPVEISAIIQGSVMLFISAQLFISWKRKNKADNPGAPEPQPVEEAEKEAEEGGSL